MIRLRVDMKKMQLKFIVYRLYVFLVCVLKRIIIKMKLLLSITSDIFMIIQK